MTLILMHWTLKSSARYGLDIWLTLDQIFCQIFYLPKDMRRRTVISDGQPIPIGDFV